MSLPVNLRILTRVPFPTQVYGSGPVTVVKANGRWTVALDYTVLGALLPPFDPTQWSMALENLTTKQFASLSLFAFIAATQNTYREITVPGDVNVGPSDVGFLINKAAPQATNIILPTSASRNGAPIWVKDLRGDSNVNNTRFVMAGVETLDLYTQAQADANGRSILALSKGSKMIWPRAAGGWYIR